MGIIGPIKYGGLNTKTASLGSVPPTGVWADIPTGQMSTCQDFDTLYGALIARKKTAVVSNAFTGSLPVNGLACYNDAANWAQGPILFATSNSILWSSGIQINPGSPVTFTNVTGTATIPGGTSTMFDILNNILVGVGDSAAGTAPFKVTAYNGTASVLAGAPKGNVIKVVNNFMFIGAQLNASSTYSTVSWCAVGDPTTWPAGNSITFRNNDGDRVIGLGAIGNDLYIFKRNSIGRLSTTTQTVAGAVTLGPLETVAVGTGTMSPLGIDNLPDGRIVFYANDGRLKIFDGSSFLDISDPPYPGPNVQGSLDEGVGGQTTTNTIVKVYPTHHQIIVSFLGLSGSSYRVYVYDYVENFWSAWTGFTPRTLLVVPFSENCPPQTGPFAQPFYLYEGNSVGRIVQMDSDSAWYGPSDETGSAINPTCTVNVMLDGTLAGFIPRSLILPFTNSTSSSGQLTITVGYDGTLSGSTTYTLGASPTFTQIVCPLPYYTSTSVVRPRTLQIKITGNPWGPVLHPFYLSDQVAA